MKPPPGKSARKNLLFPLTLSILQIRSAVKVKRINRERFLRSVQGAAMAALCGLLLWSMPLGDAWTNASYDYLFRFGTRTVTNNVSVIMMDNEAYAHFHQTRGQPWDRALHARLLNKLADDGCALVVMDSFFREPGDPAQDEALANAIRRQNHIVLMAEQSQITHPTLLGMHPLLPTEPFYSAAGKNWGVAWIDPDPDLIVRRHWPFPAPGPYPSLPQTAARLDGARLSQSTRQQWLRYYGQDGAGARLSYRFALTQPTNFFRNQIVFIGTQPKTSVRDGEPDKFCTPYTRWTGETTGGVEIMLASFLNLVNDEWLRRGDRWSEALILVFTGIVLGGGFCRMRPLKASACAAGVAVLVMLAAVSCSYFTNYWFPWLVIVGGQVPCALAWAMLVPKISRSSESLACLPNVQVQPAAARESPDIPDYELLPSPFGEGAYGKVWLARNNAGQWRAVKVIYLTNFNNDTGPYEREFNGITRYQSISDKHPALLRVDFVSEKLAGFFYYVMELGDSLEPEWEREPSTYKPHDLASERARAQGGRLRTQECLRIGLELSDALDFLHRQGLTHRDIKPQNIIFVNGRPKMADLGLIAEIRPSDHKRTFVGTPGYMPPPPELPGTPQADIYALGIVLYVISTGRNAAFFPEISTTLAENIDSEEFFTLNTIILRACQPDPAQRYASALEMHRAFQEAQKKLEGAPTRNTSQPVQ
jgi:CHASE2 domain-containing sensor protein